MASKQARLIIVLVAVLLAVVAASALVLLNVPDSSNLESTLLPSQTESPVVSPSTTNGSIFNLKILQKSGYVLLDKRLLNEKALPVPPPATVGKANPFL